MPDVFLHHHPRDKAAVTALARRLLRAGLRPWIDKWEVPRGKPRMEALRTALADCRAVVVCVGPHGMGTLPEELQPTLERILVGDSLTHADQAHVIVPVWLPGATAQVRTPAHLNIHSWVDLRSDDPGELIGLCRTLGAPRPLPQPQEDTPCPYHSLEAWPIDAARDLHGREETVERMLERLRTRTRLLSLEEKRSDSRRG